MKILKLVWAKHSITILIIIAILGIIGLVFLTGGAFPFIYGI